MGVLGWSSGEISGLRLPPSVVHHFETRSFKDQLARVKQVLEGREETVPINNLLNNG